MKNTEQHDFENPLGIPISFFYITKKLLSVRNLERLACTQTARVEVEKKEKNREVVRGRIIKVSG